MVETLFTFNIDGPPEFVAHITLSKTKKYNGIVALVRLYLSHFHVPFLALLSMPSIGVLSSDA